jgi:hypothetical protein
VGGGELSPTARGRRGRLWPDERQQLLLRAALATAPIAIDAWRRICADLALDGLDRGSERLLPLVWSNLQRHGVNVDGLEDRYRATRAANGMRLAQAAEVLRRLHAAGVPTVVLKGTALLISAYPDMGLRPMSDVDVLVPLGRITEASRSLQEQGWRPHSPVTPAMVRLTHAAPFSRAQHVSVDLHWHVFEECCQPAADNELWEASIPLTIDGAETRMPAPEDQLLHVCVHGEKWVNVPNVRWVADAMTLIRRGGIRWERLVNEAVRRQFVLRMRAQLDYLRTAFSAPIPSKTLTELGAAPVSRVERFEQRWSVRDRRRPWVLVYWCNHVRSASGSLAAKAFTFPRYLQAVWRLRSVAQVPGAALARVLRQDLPRATRR